MLFFRIVICEMLYGNNDVDCSLFIDSGKFHSKPKWCIFITGRYNGNVTVSPFK